MKDRRKKHKYFKGRAYDNIHMSNYGGTVEFTCWNCGMNIRFDPEFNALYDYPIVVPLANKWCVK